MANLTIDRTICPRAGACRQMAGHRDRWAALSVSADRGMCSTYRRMFVSSLIHEPPHPTILSAAVAALTHLLKLPAVQVLPVSEPTQWFITSPEHLDLYDPVGEFAGLHVANELLLGNANGVPLVDQRKELLNLPGNVRNATL